KKHKGIQKIKFTFSYLKCNVKIHSYLTEIIPTIIANIRIKENNGFFFKKCKNGVDIRVIDTYNTY
ncbi:MAG: hypothetical protein J6U67_06450, partial [Lachnospiraceae bacterium]|nr:hypothetical protein [Lachnospiraceae bacterium]